jgi:hypothetical protein
MANLLTGTIGSQTELLETMLPEGYYPSDEKEEDRLIDLARFCMDYKLPYPVETRSDYSKSWHALHEIGHFAIMPPWARRLGSHVMGIVTKKYKVEFSEMTGVLNCYMAGNDILPKTGFIYGDPLPYEMATRAWSIEMLNFMGWPHPKDYDPSFTKLMSFLVWDPNQPGLEEDKARMKYFGIDFPDRPVAIDDGFEPPYIEPTSVQEIISNLEAIRRRYIEEESYPYVPFNFPDDDSSCQQEYLRSCMEFLPCVN